MCRVVKVGTKGAARAAASFPVFSVPLMGRTPTAMAFAVTAACLQMRWLRPAGQVQERSDQPAPVMVTVYAFTVQVVRVSR